MYLTMYHCIATHKGFLYHKDPHPKIACQNLANIQVMFFPVPQPFLWDHFPSVYGGFPTLALVRGPLRGTVMTASPPATSVIHWHPNQHLYTCSSCTSPKQTGAKSNKQSNAGCCKEIKQKKSNFATDILISRKAVALSVSCFRLILSYIGINLFWMMKLRSSCCTANSFLWSQPEPKPHAFCSKPWYHDIMMAYHFQEQLSAW